MQRTAVTLFFLWISIFSNAQFKVRLEIHFLQKELNKNEPIYIAGTFNNWNPGDEKFKLQYDAKGFYFIDLQLEKAVHQFKFTRGSWDKVECKRNGEGVVNRSLDVNQDISAELLVEAWQDQFAKNPVVSTAGKNVIIIDTAFYIPQLKRTRRVWIYLPEAYANSKQRFPVLYMHDGQNVFDDLSSFSGEWGVDECIDTMMKKCIVVAIDNGAGKRINEYCPYDFSFKTLGLSQADTISKGEGKQYVDFIVKTLKPVIDKRYRTLKKKENTFIAGSSMGGIISMYAVLRYPKVFGGAGVFSPAFWVGPAIFDDIKIRGKKYKGLIYFYAGKEEGESMVPLTLKAFQGMSAVSKAKMTTVIRDEGKHNEARWRKEFPLFYQWMFKR